MEYELLLDKAYKNIKPHEECGRFEVKKADSTIQGSKTIISNFMQISVCLRREPEHIAKFLFKNLATSGSTDGERLILDSRILPAHINEKISEYASEYVLCPNCKKPDTELIEENQRIYMRCLACGTKKIILN